MKIAEQTQTQQPPTVTVYYRATRDDGDYTYQNTYSVPGTMPAVGAKERPAWDAARLAEQTAQYDKWYADMVKPVVPPSKAELEAQLVRAQAEKVAVEAKIVALTAAVVAANAEPLEDVKVG